MKKKSKLFLLIVFLLIVVAALPRAIELISGNYVFGYDQGKHWLAAKSIVVDHAFPLIGDEVGGGGGFFQGSGWFFLLALPFLVFHGDPFGAIVLMFLLGVGTPLLFLLLFHKHLGKKDAIAVSFALALAPILISNSRLVWPPFVIPILMVFYLWSIFQVLHGQNTFLLLLFFINGLMAHFEIATAGTLLIATVCFGLIYTVQKKISVKYLLYGICVFLVPLIPLIVFDIRHDFLNMKGVWSTLNGSRGIPGAYDFQKILSNHWMIFHDEFYRAFQVTYIPKIIMSVYLVFGTWMFLLDKKISRQKREFVLFLFVLPIFLFLILLFYKSSLWAWWISELTVVYCTLLGIVIVYLFKRNTVIRITTIVLIVLMSTSYGVGLWNSYNKELTDYGGVHKIQGKKDALDFIYTDAHGEKFGILIFTPPIYTYAYDFMLWWYGNKKYGYEPPKEKKDVYYLLIEKDWEQPWRDNGWLETVIRDGRIEGRWELPSGFIIEKRRNTLPQ